MFYVLYIRWFVSGPTHLFEPLCHRAGGSLTDNSPHLCEICGRFVLVALSRARLVGPSTIRTYAFSHPPVR